MSQTVQPLISQYKLKNLSSSHLIQSSFCSPSNIFSVSILFLFPADEPRELWKSNNPRAINPTSGHRPIQSDFSFTLFSSQHIANSTSILLFSPPEKKKKTGKCLPVSSMSRSTCVKQWKYSRPWRPLPRPLTAWMAVVLISCHGDAQAGE